MATNSARKQRGNIEERGGAYRVRVYAGVDPVTKKTVYLRETIAAGPDAKRKAEKALTRLQNQVDERRAPRTSATVNQLLDRYFEVGLDVAPGTRRDYASKASKHIRPILGSTPIARIQADTLESLYADLRRCRDHCNGRDYIQHRTEHPHVCDEHGAAGPCEPFNPSCRRCGRMCKPHQCKPYKASGIRGVHWILSGAFDAAVRWGWLGVNPADVARKPAMPTAKPGPPNAQEAAQLVTEAWVRGPDWGVFVWTAMTTGARRGELCALHWYHLELDNSVVVIERAIGKGENGEWVEKDTKTHQHRRIVLDEETTGILREHRALVEAQAEELGVRMDDRGYVFSLAPDHSTFLDPSTTTHRFERMARRLGIGSTLHKLRHYSATELLNAGVNIRAVAGRLGHGGGGATTLRVYAAWLAEADQRAAPALAGRMPARPAGSLASGAADRASSAESEEGSTPRGPYIQIARDLRGAIRCGALAVGDVLPPVKDLAHRYGVAVSTAHRAIALLADEGLIRASRGRRPVVLQQEGRASSVKLRE
ncbi:tyrosine-type recombinase/integrase [Kribbella sp. NPDC049174]|uniref:tyrosine-type recombinase/integrase n=1 Tax=Kribbella sp. NPDC049174 TaxID=3364112 RepID=UPI00371F5944